MKHKNRPATDAVAPVADLPDAADNGATISRRSVLGRTGLAAAGVVVGATAISGRTPAEAATAGTGGIGTAPAGVVVAEFMTRIEQVGIDFAVSGFLTKVTGVDTAKLFTEPNRRTEATALVTVSGTVKMVSQVIDGAVHALDIEGTLGIFQRVTGGATYTNPASFRTDSQIARYSLILQDVLTVIAPETGVPVLTGDMVQIEVGRVSGALGSRSFGRSGQRLRLAATGLGTRSEPTIPKASLTVAGTLTAL